MRPTVLNFTATGSGNSAWVPVDTYVPAAQYALVLRTTGNSVSTEMTYDDPFATSAPLAIPVTATNLASATTTQFATHMTPVRAFRLNASAAGTYSLTIVQQGTQ